MNRLALVCAAFLFVAPVALSAQSTQKEKEALPNGYRAITLGMSLEEVKAALLRDSEYGYRGDRDVSLLPGNAERVLIETDATSIHSFLDKCWFQFYENKLYIITITMNQKKMDHYSVFSTLCNKYGNPQSLDPEKSTWQNDTVIMSLERPLTLKYTDRAVFEALQKESLVQQSGEEVSRSQFLEGL